MITTKYNPVRNKYSYYLDYICVKEEYQKLYMNIEIAKIRFSIKINKDELKEFSAIEKNLYLGVIISSLFGSTSDFEEKVTNNSLTSGYYAENNNYYNFSFSINCYYFEKWWNYR